MTTVDSNVVDKLLEQIEKKDQEALKSVQIEKELVDVDLGNCLLIDNNPLDGNQLRKKKEDYLINLAKVNGQFLFNQLCDLENETVEGYSVVKLPTGKTAIPRTLPVPKPKLPTKWETFAKEKGIQHRKKEKMVWDDVDKKWKPRFGYKRIDSVKDKWIVEIPQNKDENTDMFAELQEAKRERVAKNEFQRLRNFARANKIKGTSLTPVLPKDGKELETRDEVMNAAAVARVSTASLGKFDRKLPNGLDKIESNLAAKAARNSGKKRKYEPNFGDMAQEKKKYCDVLDRLNKGEPQIDGNKALSIINQKKINAAVKNDDKKTKGKDRKSKKGKKAGKRVAFHNKSQQKKKQMGSKSGFKGKSKGKPRKGK